jgi:hypothetical protein
VTVTILGRSPTEQVTYDPIGKLVSRSDANTALAESFEYDTLNRLTKSIVSLTPTPLVATFSYNAIGNLTYKSDVGAYNYPAPGQPRPTRPCPTCTICRYRPKKCHRRLSYNLYGQSNV